MPYHTTCVYVDRFITTGIFVEHATVITAICPVIVLQKIGTFKSNNGVLTSQHLATSAPNTHVRSASIFVFSGGLYY